jgi:hypothetical protein
MNHRIRFAKAGEFFDRLIIEHFDCDEREEGRPLIARAAASACRRSRAGRSKNHRLRPKVLSAKRVHRVDDADEVLEEFRRDVFVNIVRRRELERHGEHRRAVESHPRGAVGLVESMPTRQRLSAVEHADVVEPEKSSAEDVSAVERLSCSPTT